MSAVASPHSTDPTEAVRLWDDLWAAGFVVRFDAATRKLKIGPRAWLCPPLTAQPPTMPPDVSDRVITNRTALAVLASRRERDEEAFAQTFRDGSGRGQREVEAMFSDVRSDGRSAAQRAWDDSWGRGDDSGDEAGNGSARDDA